MKFCNIASGSKGNATFIAGDNTLILIDAGISFKALEKSCKEVGFDLSRLDAVFITHEHSDHVKGLKTLSSALDIPIYMNPMSYKAAEQKYGEIFHVQEEEFIKPVQIKDLEISAFRHTHDAAYTQGFSISDGKKTVVMATDLGKMTPAILKKMENADFSYIESNYDIESLKTGPYPGFLKNRIIGQFGHLSNVESALSVRSLVEKGKERFMLAHLSEVNNTKELAKNTLFEELLKIKVKEGDIDLKIADQYVPSEVIEI